MEASAKKRALAAANQLLKEQDYLSMARVLGAAKLLGMATGVDGNLRTFVTDFAVPFLLGYDATDSVQWRKIQQAFRLVRHISFLTLDTLYLGLRWSPNVPMVLQQTLRAESTELPTLAHSVCEVLSPIERLTFERVFHSKEARREVAYLAEKAYRTLQGHANAPSEITRWLNSHRIHNLRLARGPSIKDLNRVVEIRLKSHFAIPKHAPVALESALRRIGISHPTVNTYDTWNSDVSLEATETIIDAISAGAASTRAVGRLILWSIGELDSLSVQPEDAYSLLVKNDLEQAYAAFASAAVGIALPGFRLEVAPWPLRQFGLFKKTSLQATQGAIWAAAAGLDDAVTRYLIRDRSSAVPPKYRTKYAEVIGLRRLRQYLIRTWRDHSELRQRFLLFTASVWFCDDTGPRIEFDGGLLRVSTRGGRMTWYGLETKTGRENPLTDLTARCDSIGIGGRRISLGRQHAVVECEL